MFVLSAVIGVMSLALVTSCRVSSSSTIYLFRLFKYSHLQAVYNAYRTRLPDYLHSQFFRSQRVQDIKSTKVLAVGGQAPANPN